LVFGDKLAEEEVVLVVQIKSVEFPEGNYRDEDDQT